VIAIPAWPLRFSTTKVDRTLRCIIEISVFYFWLFERNRPVKKDGATPRLL
jgi:hypothetical protein